MSGIGHVLDRAFYERDGITVARELIGKYVVHRQDAGETVGKIVETEAYIGPGDAAAHTYKGRFTERTKIIFGTGGFAYIYLIYGMYYCFNVVANKEGFPEAILVRALEPVVGLELMIKRRGSDRIRNLCSGPGKLCRAMDITRKQYGADLCGPELFITEGETLPAERILATPRINIDYAGEAIEYPWRFIEEGSRFLSGR